MNKKVFSVIAVIIIAVIVGLLFFGICKNNEGGLFILNRNTGKDNKMTVEEKNNESVGGLLGSITNYEATEELDFQYFKSLKRETPYRDLVVAIGECRGTAGFGMCYPYYRLNDGKYVWLVVSGDVDKIYSVVLCSPDDVLERFDLE